MPPRFIHFPEMSLTLVRRVSARLPHNHFLFRAAPSVTKHQVREYLEQVYGVRVARVTTSVSLGKVRRVPGKFKMFRRLKDFKRVLVRVAEEGEVIAPDGEDATAEVAGAPAEKLGGSGSGSGSGAAREQLR
jgi:ribosomal protein L23